MRNIRIFRSEIHRNCRFKSRHWLTLLIIISYILPGSLPALAQYHGGNGEPNTPFLIADDFDMYQIGLHPEHYSKHFKLIADIDLFMFTGTLFNIIGSDSKPFGGVFDGSGYKIKNFTYTSTDSDYIGLFGYVGAKARIQDLSLVGVNIDAGSGSNVGGLAGYNEGTIVNCSVVGSITATKTDIITAVCIGGLAGENLYGSITNCSVGGSVSGNIYVGGLVGRNLFGSITGCHTCNTVTGKETTGGLIGHNNEGVLTNCYSIGNVYGKYTAGGLVGINGPEAWIYPPDPVDSILGCYAGGQVKGKLNVGGLAGGNYGNVFNSYASGSVTATEDYTGGLVGGHTSGIISNCYACGLVISPGNDVGGLIGHDLWGRSYQKSFWDETVNAGLNGIGNTSDPNVIAETTANLQKSATFTNVGWDFVGETYNGDLDYWRMCGDDLVYPELSWQFLAGDLLCPAGVDILDLAYWAAHWLDVNCDASNNYCRRGDFNHDGCVDLFDYRFIAAHWLKIN
ncbi:MAG: hypothetical protein AMJ79_07970 [Phycisphaerae bacterium SM23_30]|nr:MAG: hypothetical protein AMJ79_07970 [Phycisphaerae bacterium SM23_30]